MITECNLSFPSQDCNISTKASKVRRPQQYVLASEYEKELFNKLPPIDRPYHLNKGNRQRPISGLGITGVSKETINPSYAPDSIKTTQKRKMKRNTINNEATFLPHIAELKPPAKMSKEGKKKKRESSLVELFRSSAVDSTKQKHYICNRQHGRRNRDQTTSGNNADFILSQVIDRVKLEQSIATRQLQNTIVRGKGIRGCKHYL